MKTLNVEIMQNLNIDKCDVNGSTFSLTESQRKTITKSTKDNFIAELIGLNKLRR